MIRAQASPLKGRGFSPSAGRRVDSILWYQGSDFFRAGPPQIDKKIVDLQRPPVYPDALRYLFGGQRCKSQVRWCK